MLSETLRSCHAAAFIPQVYVKYLEVHERLCSSYSLPAAGAIGIGDLTCCVLAGTGRTVSGVAHGAATVLGHAADTTVGVTTTLTGAATHTINTVTDTAAKVVTGTVDSLAYGILNMPRYATSMMRHTRSACLDFVLSRMNFDVYQLRRRRNYNGRLDWRRGA